MEQFSINFTKKYILQIAKGIELIKFCPIRNKYVSRPNKRSVIVMV